MTVDSSHDIFVFVLSLFSGVLSGLIFDFFRAMRRVFNSGKTAVAVQDIIFCALVFALFSYVVITFNDGSVRWYEAAGAILGVMLYYSAASAVIMKGIQTLMKIVKRGISAIRRIFFTITEFLKKKISFFRKKMYHFFQECTENTKKQ